MPVDVPFDPPRETLAEAVAEQLDFAARLTAIEQKLDVTIERQSMMHLKLANMQFDMGRAAAAASAGHTTLERVEQAISEIRIAMYRLLRGAKE